MFQGLLEAKTHIILLKIEIVYNKNGLRFALSYKISEKIFYCNSYTGKLYTFRHPFLGSRSLPNSQYLSKCAKLRKRSPRIEIFEISPR